MTIYNNYYSVANKSMFEIMNFFFKSIELNLVASKQSV